MPVAQRPACLRCGARDSVVHTPESDPLQVTECGRCGSILEIGSQQW